MLEAHALQPTSRTVPPSVVYLPVEINSSPKPRPAIGLSWRAEPEDLRRSLPMRLVTYLLAELPCDVEVLQQSLTTHEARRFPSARSRSLLELADVIAGLDLVITVDSVVAHLSTALGRPTWLLLHANSDGRWRPFPTETSWNSTMRIYEQLQPGDWNDVIRVVADDLCLCCRGDSFVVV